MGKQITIDTEALDELIDAKVRAAKAEAGHDGGGTPESLTPAQWQDQVDRLKGRQRAIPQFKLIACKSDTGATFDARIVRSRAFPTGRIVCLENYQHPAGYDKHLRDGGLVSDGVPLRDHQTGQFLPLFKQYLYETYWKADLQYFVGRAWSDRFRASPLPGGETEAWEGGHIPKAPPPPVEAAAE